ncbi:hypothetical protein RND81_10G017500 [Saponaria officinalis]|uniref:Disease resistance R13L4/SHOC-2-like LRR domain-containing protein n=1 Tax=Saponaria officinalis TaxID=3572 RepID=A0AAW1HZL9_SAPOF
MVVFLPLNFLQMIFLLSFIVFFNFSAKFECFAQLIPEDEVKTLQIISDKLKNIYWENISQNSCTDRGASFNQTITTTIFSNVSCDCSFNSSTICHVTHMALMGNRNTITLQKLTVEDNQFTGTIPKTLGNLKNLQSLVLAANFFNGTLPETFANLKNLTELRLNGNAFSGKIPEFLGNLTNITTLDIQGTSMEGPIPSSLSAMTNMQTLRISDLNTASLAFPNLTGMTKLKELVLRNCSIIGRVPDYIGNLMNLKLMFLTNNSFSGQLPDWILNSKQKFDVSYNNFTALRVHHQLAANSQM